MLLHSSTGCIQWITSLGLNTHELVPTKQSSKAFGPPSLSLPAPPPSQPLPSTTSPPNLPQSSTLALPPIKAWPLCRDAVHKSCQSLWVLQSLDSHSLEWQTSPCTPNPPLFPKILTLKTSQLTIPHYPLSLAFSPSLALSSPSAQSINLSSAPAPLALCPICRCLWKHPRSPQPLHTPRLVQGQELLTKAQCGNEGCVEGGKGVLKGGCSKTDGWGSLPTPPKGLSV